MKYRSYNNDNWETVVGDEMQTSFYPRVKIKKWGNAANLSIGLKDSGGTYSATGNEVSYKFRNGTSNFYPISKDSSFDKKTIRYIKQKDLNPVTISSQFEIDKNYFWSNQTILSYNVNCPSMLYYGSYNTSDYITSIDIPECRFSGEMNWNPLYMDAGLKFVEIHFSHDRDDVSKIEPTFIQATKDIVSKYVNIVDQKGGKLYFDDNGKKVKFFSGGTFETAYMVYINISSQYNDVYKYYKSGIDNTPNDQYAYGLSAANSNLPDDLVDQIIKRYSTLIGIPLKSDTFNGDENNLIKTLNDCLSSNSWIKNADRSQFPPLSSKKENDGFEFEIVLNNKPSTNIVPLSVQSTGLAFYYQNGIPGSINDRIPDNVVGSYAAYRTEPVRNQSNKAFHIYRPWAVDSKGKKVWCAFDPNWDGVSDLNITVPQSFLDSANYPITIDPTFGYTIAGSASTVYSPPNNNNGNPAINKAIYRYSGIMSAPGRSAQIAFNAAINSASGSAVSVVVGLYGNVKTYANGGPRVDYSNPVSYVGSTGRNWYFCNLNVNPQLDTTTIYDSIVFINIPANSWQIYASFTIYWDGYFAGAGLANVYSSPPPVTEPTLVANNNVYSIYLIQALNGPMLMMGIG